MPIAEELLMDAIMQTRSQIDFLWQFFITVQIALFALLFIYDKAIETFNSFARLLAICGVGIFDWINSQALKNSYTLLNAFHEQYRADFGQPQRFQSVLYEHFVLANFEGRVSMIGFTHGMAFAVVVMAFLWRRSMQHHPK
ncbi:hypothetical protein ACO2I3_20195 [Leptospira interrogans]